MEKKNESDDDLGVHVVERNPIRHSQVSVQPSFCKQNIIIPIY